MATSLMSMCGFSSLPARLHDLHLEVTNSLWQRQRWVVLELRWANYVDGAKTRVRVESEFNMFIARIEIDRMEIGNRYRLEVGGNDSAVLKSIDFAGGPE